MLDTYPFLLLTLCLLSMPCLFQQRHLVSAIIWTICYHLGILHTMPAVVLTLINTKHTSPSGVMDNFSHMSSDVFLKILPSILSTADLAPSGTKYCNHVDDNNTNACISSFFCHSINTMIASEVSLYNTMFLVQLCGLQFFA